MTKAYDKIAAGLDDAIAYAHGDESRGRIARAGQKAAETLEKVAELKPAGDDPGALLAATLSAIADYERALKRIAKRAETLPAQWERAEIVQSRGPRLEFTGRLLAETKFETRGRTPTALTYEVWETQGGALIAASYGDPLDGGREFVQATVVPPGEDEMARRCAVMEAFDWNDRARSMLGKIGWNFRVEVD